MVTKKFGLAELARYTSEVGFKNGDVRTIKGVLAIVGIPNSVVQEAEDAISAAKTRIYELLNTKTTIEQNDAQDEANTKDQISVLRQERNERKAVNKAETAGCSTAEKLENTEIKQLETILKKFA